MNINSIHETAMQEKDDTRPILVVPYTWIGDFVRGHTVVRVLKQRWPNRPIDLLATSLCAPLVDYMPGVCLAWFLVLGVRPCARRNSGPCGLRRGSQVRPDQPRALGRKGPGPLYR